MKTAGTTAAYAIAAITGVLGAGSLALFGLFLWRGALGLVDLGLPERVVWGWDAGLCLLFFVQHSVMVRRSFRDRLGAVLPGHWHGVVYTIASAAALLLLAGLWQRSATVIYAASGTQLWLARAVLLLSLAGVLWGIGSLKEFDAFGTQAFLSQVRGTPGPAPVLTIAGPYRWVRHPFYCCGILAVWAAPVLSLDRLILNCLFTAWIVLGARLEERDLLAEFGDGYRRYQRAAPMLVPSIPRYRKKGQQRR